MSIYSNRQMCESVCKKESACGECILQDAQNMTEVVWQLGHKRLSELCSTSVGDTSILS